MVSEKTETEYFPLTSKQLLFKRIEGLNVEIKFKSSRLGVGESEFIPIKINEIIDKSNSEFGLVMFKYSPIQDDREISMCFIYDEMFINLPLDKDISDPTTGMMRMVEQTVSHQGRWRIHKSDPDNLFPSDPHADRVDAPEKLDLYTGNVFDKSRKFLYALSPKAMKFIYYKIMKSGEENIKQKLIANQLQITYL